MYYLPKSSLQKSSFILGSHGTHACAVESSDTSEKIIIRTKLLNFKVTDILPVWKRRKYIVIIKAVYY